MPARSPRLHARPKALAAFSALLWCVAPQTRPAPNATAPAATSAWARRGRPFRAWRRAFNLGAGYRRRSRTSCTLSLRAVTTIDWIIVAFAALMALRGARSGFIVGALSLAGFVVGA